MSDNETLGSALDRTGASDQKSLLSSTLQGMTKAQITSTVNSGEGNLSDSDKKSLHNYMKARANKGQSALPWTSMDFTTSSDGGGSSADPNW